MFPIAGMMTGLPSSLLCIISNIPHSMRRHALGLVLSFLLQWYSCRDSCKYLIQPDLVYLECLIESQLVHHEQEEHRCLTFIPVDDHRHSRLHLLHYMSYHPTDVIVNIRRFDNPETTSACSQHLRSPLSYSARWIKNVSANSCDFGKQIQRCLTSRNPCLWEAKEANFIYCRLVTSSTLLTPVQTQAAGDYTRSRIERQYTVMWSRESRKGSWWIRRGVPKQERTAK